MLQCRETWYLTEQACTVPARSEITCKDGGHVVKKIIALCKQYREIIVYLIVGVMTTIVSWAAYAVCKLFLDVQDPIQMDVAVVIRWTTGVVFAYFTNRAFVFQSKNPNMLKEAISFTSSRLVTLVLELVIMRVLPFVFGLNDWISTFIAAVVITVTNYIFSKFIVFRKKKEDS
ncbi:MAG: GtrA family protein [Lachnospiraceae bacterium]|nr:GtrA family protein [Lachnospiraceae bacterium]